ncbi:hypothetical protein Ae168Ps1_1135 [Pseudonocardia sp. Ae168_Ps1]|uniref:hypothetical protein n=1 Tax=unclassified Pseudonocardia TaxID=2619320 RepID=UPI00094AB9CB|nr:MULTISPECIES: hypothetical protein [unclassified Pseudonocardia]OLL72756.1 hypothetical protein Ae150APs1_1134 [Pseudonocardia sp. Ae150A_Ps1]OLL78729.1 hypothetical protein Ae168Ps1_1135 [Pseudonocardia sp. Ae168_Ps1]OLL87143.1 hypothetical protein Ae263Ps1_4198c [Pseudonocardia sp. Ae263_Ps1]OLL92827.1 hypothetical protein Ae356Ps1_2724 [Pseudonocardia sp. Ae356_Ps1]
MDGSLPARGVRLRSDLRAAGFDEDEIGRALARGELVAIRRGAYLEAADPALTQLRARHRAAVRAALRQLAPGAVASHVSAAVVRGLDTWGLPLDRVHVTRDRSHGGHRTRDLHVHPSPLASDDRTTVGGIAVTTPARTVVDIARTAGFERGLVVADRALARRSQGRPPVMTPDELAATVTAAAGRSGIGTVRRVAAAADGRSGSVGETRSRIALAWAGFPAPVLQWEVHCGGHRHVTDFAWPEQRVVAEFDGRVKYGRKLRPDQDPAEVLWEEKLREDRLRAEGLAVVRWTWADLADFAEAAARLRRALAS